MKSKSSGFIPLETCRQRKFLTGFTLLEILLVVGIIAILAAIVIIAINPGRQFAQVANAERRSDIKQIYNAMQQYYIDHGDYPASTTPDILTEICDTGIGEFGSHSVDCTNLIDLSALVPKYITAIPVDPSGASSTLSFIDKIISKAYAAIGGTGFMIMTTFSGGIVVTAPLASLGTTISIGATTIFSGPRPITMATSTGCITNSNGFYAGDGSAGDPYQICNWTQLNNIRNWHSGSNYKLITDLSSADYDYGGIGSSWVPISSFRGNLNGHGHTISDLTINLPATNGVGLFSLLDAEYGSVSNLGLVDVNITGNAYVGAIAGSTYAEYRNYGVDSISNCYVTGTITGQFLLGGLVGDMGDRTNIVNSYAVVNFIPTSSLSVGGVALVGGTVTNSFWDREVGSNAICSLIWGWSYYCSGTAASTTVMKTPSTYSGWDTNIWNITAGSYPTLISSSSPLVSCEVVIADGYGNPPNYGFSNFVKSLAVAGRRSVAFATVHQSSNALKLGTDINTALTTITGNSSRTGDILVVTHSIASIGAFNYRYPGPEYLGTFRIKYNLYDPPYNLGCPTPPSWFGSIPGLSSLDWAVNGSEITWANNQVPKIASSTDVINWSNGYNIHCAPNWLLSSTEQSYNASQSALHSTFTELKLASTTAWIEAHCP